MKIRFRNIILPFLMVTLIGLTTGHGQITEIRGKIVDAQSHEPISFANVYFLGSTIGATTDLEGKYHLKTQTPGDSLLVTYVGYYPMKKLVKKGKKQVINFELDASQVFLNEVVVIPDEAIMDLMFKWIINNKDKNDSRQHDFYECEVYNRVQIDVNNIKPELRERKAFKHFQFIFDYLDTSDVNGKSFLPMMLAESISNIYYRKEPTAKKEINQAYKISGIENESLAQYIGRIYQSINIYDNYITLFDKNFISPIANFGKLYYDYDLADTVYLDNHRCFKIDFTPKRKQELTFSGTLWIHDTTFAVKKMDMKVVDDANVNFINDFVVTQDFNLIDGRYWMVTKEHLMADINPIEDTKKMLGFFVRRTSTYKDYILNQPLESEFYNAPVNFETNNKALEKDDAFWMETRHEPLTKKESDIYVMIDSVKNVPAFNTYVDIFFMLTYGYIKMGRYFEFGPVYKTLSFNDIEGVRLRAGGQTGLDFSSRVRLNGYLAYGFKDQKLKYGVGGVYMLNNSPRKLFGLNYKYDMEQLGLSSQAFAEDNFFSSFFRTSPANKLTMVQEYNGFYEHEWFNGFSTTIKFVHRDIFSLGDSVFIIYEGDETIEKNSIISSEIQLNTRFAFGEKYIYGDFNRVNLGTKYPVLELNYGYGIPDFLGSEYKFHRLQFRIKHWFNVMSFGWSKYIFTAGKIWGTLPYSLLKIHEGNETFIFYETAFNLMNYYENISDQFISLSYAHHFDGLILDRVPLMRKLKWRTVIHAKSVIGTMTEANQNYSEFPEFSGTLEHPYAEAGVGIENIFKILRVDAIWRLSHLEREGADKFRVFFTMQFNF